MTGFADRVRGEALRALPYGLVLALALGAAVSVGAHYSNAFPSQERPFGWPGPSAFTNAVAMVRDSLVLATTIPALLLGARALAHLDPAADRARGALTAFLGHALVLVVAALTAGAIGGIFAFHTPPTAFLAFSVAHALLALSFYSLAFACAAALPRLALPAAAGVWLVFNAMYEALVRTAVFRQVGYHGASAGAFPGWFYVAQALSPLSAYRGVLILWERRFMDALEKAALGGASLPAWMNAGTFVALTLVLWVALPVGLALLAWSWRGRAGVRAKSARPLPERSA